MARIHPIDIDAVDRDTNFIQWRVAGLGANTEASWRVHVRTSLSEGGPWTYLRRDLPIDVYGLRHTTKRRDRWSAPFYVIELEHTTNPELSVQSEAVYPRHPPDVRAVGIRRRLDQLLRGEHGVRIVFFKRRIEGQVDEEAFDPLLHRPTGQPGRSFGHQYAGGFYWPIETWAKIDIAPRVVQALPAATLAPSSSQCWLAGTPLVSPGDLIVERHVNRRWRVREHIQRFARRQTLFRQIFNVEEVAIGDPEYALALPKIDSSSASDVNLGVVLS